MSKITPKRSPVPVERRRSPRYKLQDGSLAVNSTILGPILDLSKNGMSFEYYADDLDDIPLTMMGIFISDSKLFLTDLQTKIIREHIIKDKDSFLPVIRKTRAVEFIGLSIEQLHQIHQIIATQGIRPY